jgi:hypothetical protein
LSPVSSQPCSMVVCATISLTRRGR